MRKFYYDDILFNEEDKYLSFKVVLIDDVAHEQIIADFKLFINIEKLLLENIGKNELLLIRQKLKCENA